MMPLIELTGAIRNCGVVWVYGRGGVFEGAFFTIATLVVSEYASVGFPRFIDETVAFQSATLY